MCRRITEITRLVSLEIILRYFKNLLLAGAGISDAQCVLLQHNRQSKCWQMCCKPQKYEKLHTFFMLQLYVSPGLFSVLRSDTSQTRLENVLKVWPLRKEASEPGANGLMTSSCDALQPLKTCSCKLTL